MRLSDVAVGETVKLGASELPATLAHWVSAIGLCEGEEIRVLQRGPVGGPLHVRTSAGVELAVARDVAQFLVVERL